MGKVLFLILILTNVQVVHNENLIVYGFPLGYISIYPKATELISSFSVNIFSLLINFTLVYFIVAMYKKVRFRIAAKTSREEL